MHILNYSIIAMTEIPFIFTSLGTIYFLIRMEKQKLPFKDYNFWLFFILFDIKLLYSTNRYDSNRRIIIYFLFDKNWKMAMYIIVGIFNLHLPWYLRNKSLGEEYQVESQITLKNSYRPELGPMKL